MGILEASRVVEIDAPKSECYAIIADLPSTPEWQESMISLEVIETNTEGLASLVEIKSDGKVKGCPSLPTAPYVGGNVRDLSLEQIWADSPELRFARERGTEELWGFCATCTYAEVCRGGCSFTAHTTLGRRGNNPFCYHRAATLRKAGRRERLVQRERAAGQPYDFGRFEIIEEDWPV